MMGRSCPFPVSFDRIMVTVKIKVFSMGEEGKYHQLFSTLSMENSSSLLPTPHNLPPRIFTEPLPSRPQVIYIIILSIKYGNYVFYFPTMNFFFYLL